jgi:hypothetical protein
MADVELIGAFAFGVSVGYITYRTLARSTEKAQVSDIASVLGAVGGGAVTSLFHEDGSAFGWYAIGLALGMVIYLVLSLLLRGKEEVGASVLGEGEQAAPLHSQSTRRRS